MGAERDVVGKPLSIIFGKSWSTGEIPDDLRKDSVTHMFKKTDDSGKPYPGQSDLPPPLEMWNRLFWRLSPKM